MPGRPVRNHAFPQVADPPVCVFRDTSRLKLDPDYGAAKAGYRVAAFRFVTRIAPPLIPRVQAMKQPGARVLSAHAMEASGNNAIPQVLARFLALNAGLDVALGVVQSTRAYHTGADAMQRLISRPDFDGPVGHGVAHILVDDVSTLGGTLAELSDYVQSRGGLVVGAAVLANASRSGHLVPESRIVRLLEDRFGDHVEDLFGIRPAALTRDEAQYLVGFRTSDELRNRAAQARADQSRRLRS